MHVTTLGIDVAKHVFQMHEVDARRRAVLSRRVKRGQLLQTVASLPSCTQYLTPPLMIEGGAVDFSRTLTYPSIRSITT